LIYSIKQAITAGINVPVRALPGFLTFGKRQNDVFGAGWAMIYPNNAIGSPSNTVSAITGSAADNPEHIIEAYYKLQITDSFAFIPSTQLIFSRMGDEDNEVDVVVGLRSSFTF
jgi:carbohydrate-selective porin OprB